jgi:hypothetical protein
MARPDHRDRRELPALLALIAMDVQYVAVSVG